MLQTNISNEIDRKITVMNETNGFIKKKINGSSDSIIFQLLTTQNNYLSTS